MQDEFCKLLDLLVITIYWILIIDFNIIILIYQVRPNTKSTKSSWLNIFDIDMPDIRFHFLKTM